MARKGGQIPLTWSETTRHAGVPPFERASGGASMRALSTVIVTACLACAADGARAQNVGSPQAGLAFARTICADCHAIESKAANSPNPAAPTFQRIANVPGMTETALYVSLQTPHRTMPDLHLEGDELRNVAAYILSLRTTR
jgi:mono/diheme cytochrome c family protein